MKNFFKKYHQHILIVLLILLSGVATAFRYQASIIRMLQAGRDFGISIAYYFCAFFDVDIAVTVNELPDMSLLYYLPYDVDEILRRLTDMWTVFWTEECFVAYLQKVLLIINEWCIYFMLFFPLIMISGYLLVQRCLAPNEDQHGEKTKALLRFEDKHLPRLVRIRAWCVSGYRVFLEHWYFFWPFMLIWALNLNVITIILEVLAYYFYFIMSFDIASLLVQAGKAVLDILIMFSGAPWPFWLAVVYAIIVVWRKSVGYKRLDVREISNRQFIEEQPIVMMLTGTMGTGKTMTLTDIGLSCEMMFRDVALTKILEIDMKYPNFPWILLEDEVKAGMREHHIYSLTTCRDYIADLRACYESDPNKDTIFGYDISDYRTSFDDALCVRDLWSDIENYACLYFIYVIEGSLLVSNYSVRVDNVLEYAGNLPLWHSSWFQNTPEQSRAVERHAHILDFDVLRLGCQVLKDNPRRGSFEFGVVLISEIGKERGNTLTLQDLKKKDEQTNQKNDLFSYAIKMCRHKATVDNFPFIRIICDEQRPESLGADMRDLLNIVHIRHKSAPTLVMPWFFVTEIVHDFVYPHWKKFYLDYRYSRGDMCLPVYFGHNLISKFHNFYVRTYNIFGVSELDVDIESGTQDGTVEPMQYFLCSKKIRSNRYSTDCYRGYFEKQLRQTKYGLEDYFEYADTIATLDELHELHSFFIDDMEKVQD